MDCNMSGFPVFHCLLESTQTHIHLVSDIIQPSHPLLPPSPPAFNLSQHQGLFQWVSSSFQVAKILKLQLQDQFFQWLFRIDFLYNWLISFIICLLCKRLSRVLKQHRSKTSILQHSAFFMFQFSQANKIFQLLSTWMNLKYYVTLNASDWEEKHCIISLICDIKKCKYNKTEADS